MTRFLSSRIRSFGHAFGGWWYVVRTQRNAWIHVIITVVVITLSFWLGLGTRDWAIIILTTAMVFAAEFFNTAIEALVDLVSPQPHRLAKISKDVSAGAVLLAALAAALVGVLILGPPLWARLSALFPGR